MKKFLYNILKFLLGSVIIILILVISSGVLVQKFFNYNLNNKHILILGDSHTLCGVDDDVIPLSINLSESADTYFYSYLKLREFCNKNKNIKTVVLGFAEHNITESQDNWLRSEEITHKKLPFYYFLFKEEDFKDFIQINPFYLITFSGDILKRNFLHLLKIYKNLNVKEFGIGTHLKLFNDKKNDVILKSNKNIAIKRNAISEIDLLYLKKIASYCSQNKLKLILLNTPVLEKEHNFSAIYLEMYQQNFKDAVLLDFSNEFQNKKFFKDSSHLNNKGAINFSISLKNTLYPNK